MVNFCQSFWKGRADTMAPLATLSGWAKGKSQPTPELVSAFNAVKQLIAENVPLAFPNPNVPFNIHTDASDLQSGAVIKQHNETIAFFSHKSSAAQLKCPAVDKEMLCIVEVPKECCFIS